MTQRLSCDIIDSEGHIVGRAYALTAAQNEKFRHMAVNTVTTLEDYPLDMQEEFLFFDLFDMEDFDLDD